MAIQSFRDWRTRSVWLRDPACKLPLPLQRSALRKLMQLDAAADLRDLRVPSGNRLEKLKGDRAGQYSLRINDQWRLCFRWEDVGAKDVELVDYH